MDEGAGRNEVGAVVVQANVFVAELKQIEGSSVRDYRKRIQLGFCIPTLCQSSEVTGHLPFDPLSRGKNRWEKSCGRKRYFPAVAHGVKRDPVVGVVVPDAAEGVPAGFVVDQLDLLALFGG